MINLNDLAIKHNTDKSSKCHDYCRIYEKCFVDIRLNKLNILEIGVNRGDSLRMWKEYFPYSRIVGIDIDLMCKSYEEENINVEIGDQIDVEFLNLVCKKYNGFDIIIDDGCHRWKHQIVSFEILFPYLNSGGFYVIEDTHTSYEPGILGYDNAVVPPIQYFKQLVNQLNYLNVKQRNVGLTEYEKKLDTMLFFRHLLILQIK